MSAGTLATAVAPILKVRDLRKHFQVARGSLHAVDDISFDIMKGRTLGMVGESGCGKSTTGRLLVRLHEATSGSIVYDGTEVTKADVREMKQLRTRMQMIFQDPYSSIKSAAHRRHHHRRAR